MATVDTQKLDEAIIAFSDLFLKLVVLENHFEKNDEMKKTAEELCSKLDEIIELVDLLIDYDVTNVVQAFKDDIMKPYTTDKYASESKGEVVLKAIRAIGFFGASLGFVNFVEKFSGKLGENAADGVSTHFSNFINKKGTIVQEAVRCQTFNEKLDDDYVIPDSVKQYIKTDQYSSKLFNEVFNEVKNQQEPFKVPESGGSKILKEYEKLLQQLSSTDKKK